MSGARRKAITEPTPSRPRMAFQTRNVFYNKQLENLQSVGSGTWFFILLLLCLSMLAACVENSSPGAKKHQTSVSKPPAETRGQSNGGRSWRVV